MTNYRFSSAALTELRQATLYYEEQENGLGVVFLDEIEAAVERILANPHAWHPLSPRTRRCRTHRFPFGLIYQIRSDEISYQFGNGLASRSYEMAAATVSVRGQDPSFVGSNSD